MKGFQIRKSQFKKKELEMEYWVASYMRGSLGVYFVFLTGVYMLFTCIYILFVITAAGVVPCGSPKKPPLHHV